jgi:hypothetical protein
MNGRVGTVFSRVFGFHHLGLEKLKHTFEPEVRYLYVPAVSRPVFTRELPPCIPATKSTPAIGVPGQTCGATIFSEGFLFDNQDAINQRNFVSYGVTTRLLVRGASTEEAAAAAAAAAPPPETPPPAAAPPPAGGSAPTAAPQAAGAPSGASAPTAAPAATPAATAPAAAPKGPLPPSRELLRASILHGYDISRQLSGDSHASAVDLLLRAYPLAYLSLGYNATLNPAQGGLLGQSADFTLRDPWYQPTNIQSTRYQTSSFVNFSYRFVADSSHQFAPGSIDQTLLASPGLNFVQGLVYLRLTDYLGAAAFGRYSFIRNAPSNQVPGFIERDYLVHVLSHCKCWTLDFGVTQQVNPNETLFRVQFSLLGLGSVGQNVLGRIQAFAPLAELGYNRAGFGGGVPY